MSEAIAEALARDTRFAVLAQAIAVEGDLRDNETIKALLAAVRADADQAMDDIALTSPEDKVRIADLFVRVRTLVFVRNCLDTVIRRGQAAEQSIRAEDVRQEDE